MNITTVFDHDVRYWIQLKFKFRDPIHVNSDPFIEGTDRFLVPDGFRKKSMHVWWPGYCNQKKQVNGVTFEGRYETNDRPDEAAFKRFLKHIMESFQIIDLEGAIVGRMFEESTVLAVANIFFAYYRQEGKKVVEYALTPSAIDWLTESIDSEDWGVVSDALLKLHSDDELTPDNVCERNTIYR